MYQALGLVLSFEKSLYRDYVRRKDRGESPVSRMPYEWVREGPGVYHQDIIDFNHHHTGQTLI